MNTEVQVLCPANARLALLGTLAIVGTTLVALGMFLFG
jgi:hypothetical protein